MSWLPHASDHDGAPERAGSRVAGALALLGILAGDHPPGRRHRRPSIAVRIGRFMGRCIGFLRISLWGWAQTLKVVGRILHPLRLGQEYLLGVGNVLIAFGAALLLMGAGVRVTRHMELSAAADARPTPNYEAVRAVMQAPTPRPTPLPEATEIPPPDRITIPFIALDAPVKEIGWSRVVNGNQAENVWQTANYAAGFHENSALPGEPGNTVISGHNNIKGSVFANIHKLTPGNKILVYRGDVEYVYAVAENFVVKEAGASPEERRQNARWIAATEDERLTLVTCYPPWSNTHRTIVIARPVGVIAPSDGQDQQVR